MNLDFSAVLAGLGPDAAFSIANAARPASELMFATLLPEVPMWDYTVKSGTMSVRATMAGLAAIDSPYPPGGVIDSSTFMAESAKIANEVQLNEYTLRQLQQMVLQASIGGQPTNQMVVNEVLNFLDTVIIQAHMDTMEYLRGQALVFGAINWTFNKLNLVVNYGFTAGNILATRTGTASWDSTASGFWADVWTLHQKLNYDVRAFIAHPDTIRAIASNAVNTSVIEGTIGVGGSLTLHKMSSVTGSASSDSRDRVTLISYGLEGEILNPATPGVTTKVPFMPRGYLLAVGNSQRRGYRVGMGATGEDPTLTGSLGHTHLAPTVEGGGRPGRWAQLYTPQAQPMKLNGRGVTNGLPVIETPQAIAVARSDLASIGVDIP